MSTVPRMDRPLKDYPTISSLCTDIAIAMDWDTYESILQVLKESVDRVVKNETIWRKECQLVVKEEKNILSKKKSPMGIHQYGCKLPS